MTVKTGLGFYPTNGLAITGRIDQTSRLEVNGTYNAATGTTLGTRVVCHRIYGSFSAVTGGTAWTSGSQESLSFYSGHVVLWSSSGNGTTSAPFYPAVIAGTYDTALKNTFARIEALPWSGTIDRTLTTPGASYGGTLPAEMIWLQNHEPNINSGTTYGTAAQFAGMMKHIAQLYDTWCTANSIAVKHIKFAVCLSNPSNISTADTYYDRGNSNDITATGARPMDYAGWDIYWPRTENSGQGAVTASSSDEVAFSATGKYGKLRTWTAAYMPAGTYDIIPEFAIRMPTSPVTGGAGPDPTWPATWYAAADTWMASHLVSSNYPVKYMCQYVAASVLSNTATGGADNSIIPDQVTHSASYQVAGVSLRPAFTAFRTQLIAWGNASLPNSTTPGTPTIPLLPAAPTAGQTSTVITLPSLPANATTFNLYKDGVKSRTGLAPGNVTVYYTSTLALPQSPVYTCKGVAADGITEGPASPGRTVNYLAAAGSVPGSSGAPTVTNVGQTTATFTVTAVATATGYAWYLDSNTTTASPDFTSTSNSVAASPLASGAHTVTCKPFNASGYAASFSTASSSFTMASAPDTTAPSVPSGLAATPTATSVLLSWAASTDTVVAGAITSGMGTYTVTRTDSVNGTVTLSGPSLVGTSLTDTSPPASTAGTVAVTYGVAAVDNAGNASAYATLAVTIPQLNPGTSPTAGLNLPSSAGVGQLFTFSDASSPGSGGPVSTYTVQITGPGGYSNQFGPSGTSSWRISLPYFGLFTFTETVSDATGATGQSKQSLIAYGSDNGVFPVTGALMEVPGQPGGSAGAANTKFGLADTMLGELSNRLDGHDEAFAQLGDPLTPRRHNGCLYASVNPEAVGTQLTLAAATLYVVRCMTMDGAAFSTINWTQAQVSPSAVTNAFMAVYDVTGALMSPTGALTDISAKWTVKGEQSFALDGGPFDPPLGADSTDPSVTPPSNEFFIAFYLGTAGATKPQITAGSLYPTVNIGTSLTAITPTQATIQNVPLFSTSAATVTTALNAPASLGALTRLDASTLLAIYP